MGATMFRSRKLLGSAALCSLAMGFAFLPERTASRSPEGMSMPQSGADGSVPAFHTQVPPGALPATMNPEFFSDPVVQNAYTVAGRVKKTLYQQPCYCHCDRSQGHGSLLDCFASKHGAGCNICIGEDFYAYDQLRKGKTAAQIRAGIIQGEWQSVDLTKYQKPLPVK